MSWLDEFYDWVGTSGDDALSSSDLTTDDVIDGADGLVGDHNKFTMQEGESLNDAPAQTKDYSSFGMPAGNSVSPQEETNSSAPRSLSAKEGEDKGLFGQATDFVEKNKRTTDMIGGVVMAGYNSSQKKKEESKQYERMLEQRAYNEKIQKEKEDRADARKGGGGGGSSGLEMLAAKDALEQAKNARFSASITGLQQTGLINKAKKLKYVEGQPVYTNNGNLT